MMVLLPFSLAFFVEIRVPPLWLAVMVGLLTLAVGLGLSIVLVQRVWRIRWKASTERHYLHLRNTGNLPATLQVSTVSPDGQLRFNYLLDGALLNPMTSSYNREERLPLPVQPVSSPSSAAPASMPVQPAPKASEPAGAPHPAGTAAQVAKSVGAAGAAAESKANAAFSLVGVFAMILNTVGSLLPGDAGRAFSQKAADLQKTVSKARFKMQAPVQKVRQAQSLRNQVNTLQADAKGQVPVRTATEQSGQGVQDQAVLEPVLEAGQLMPNAPAQPDLPAMRRETFTSHVIQLPPLLPETGLTVELRVEPRNRYRRGEYIYWLLTQTVEPICQAEPEKTVRSVKVQRLPIIYWLLSMLLSVSVVLFNTAWTVALVFWLARLLGMV